MTSSEQCEPHNPAKHCVVTTDPPFLCGQTCEYMYTGHEVIPSCNNKIASYQYVEYQCIPTKTALVSTDKPCANDGTKTTISINRNGRFQSYNYPSLQKMNCTYRLKTKPGYIMHIYALDISLNNYADDCQSNKIIFIEDADSQGLDFCEQRIHSLIYSSCSNELDLRYIVTNEIQVDSKGVELYIESQAHPIDWSCGEALSTPIDSTIIRTTPEATPLTNVSYMVSLDEVEYDICYGYALIQACPRGYTFMINDAYYGVKSQPSNKCGFVRDDCVQEATSTITLCQNDLPNCYLPYSNKRRLAQCSNKEADYLHVTYQCIPSFPVGSPLTLPIYNICEANNSINDMHGIVSSPNFPQYQQTNNECQREMFGVRDHALKIWINELSIASSGQRTSNGIDFILQMICLILINNIFCLFYLDDSDKPDFTIHKNTHVHNLNNLEQAYPSIRDTCVTDYLIIDTPLVSYIYCGKRKLSLPPICATNVKIQYKTISAANLFYKGFKFYFEWVTKTMETICPGNPLTIDPAASTTSLIEVWPLWAQNLEVSSELSKHLCWGTCEHLTCPRSIDYVLSIKNSYYGVTGTGLCDLPSLAHCHQEAALGLVCGHSCFIEYTIQKPLSQCQNQTAEYMNIDYECIPTRLPDNENPMDICASTPTNTIAIDRGMFVSPQYPSLGATRSCFKTIQTLPSKIWKIYIVDLFLEDEDEYGNCNEASLTIFDGNDKLTICGLQQAKLILMSCSNSVQFSFKSAHEALGYRGFKVLFQSIDIPDGWSCIPPNFTTTTKQTTTRTSPPTTLIPPSFQSKQLAK